jgi:bifunctional UDP-N-acetylglucosamine pyrophosphorylase/glucosamine-1-phosphate N-acetyltransferase
MSEAQSKVEALLARGVVIPAPASVEIGEEVRPERIAPGVVIHAGCRIAGASTSIGPGSDLGAEGPAAVEDCQLGRNVSLKGGSFSGATFLDGAAMGPSAHVRPGTLLEEESCAAHSVGLKQTLFLPFVTAGSLINFCDALMAGGTSRRNHSEIGSSYIHFNFTPHQDKATPSLVGDVPGGVMLDRAPIFLGGQGGLVGPVRIAFGTVIPAGAICRKDVTEEGQLFVPPPAGSGGSRPFTPGAYGSIGRIVRNNLAYVGNLQALKAWYVHARKRTMAADEFALACHAGAVERIEAVLDERISRLGDLAQRMAGSLELARAGRSTLNPTAEAQQKALLAGWPEMEAVLRSGPALETGARDRDVFLAAWEKAGGKSHIEAVAALAPEAKRAGTAWLQAIVDSAAALWTAAGNDD